MKFTLILGFLFCRILPNCVQLIYSYRTLQFMHRKNDYLIFNSSLYTVHHCSDPRQQLKMEEHHILHMQWVIKWALLSCNLCTFSKFNINKLFYNIRVSIKIGIIVTYYSYSVSALRYLIAVNQSWAVSRYCI